MFLKKEPTLLEQEIDRLTRGLKGQVVGTDEYVSIVEMISKLQKLKNDENSSRLSKDTMLLAGANILGILLIISTEREHVITTKALGMLQRTKN